MEITKNKKVIIINGKGEVGKDTFVKIVQKSTCCFVDFYGISVI